jgi:hypothetical protein
VAPLQHPAAGRSSHLTHDGQKEVTRCNREPGPPRHSPRRGNLGPRNRDCTTRLPALRRNPQFGQQGRDCPISPGPSSGHCQGPAEVYQRAGCFPPVSRKASTATGQKPRRQSLPSRDRLTPQERTGKRGRLPPRRPGLSARAQRRSALARGAPATTSGTSTSRPAAPAAPR